MARFIKLTHSEIVNIEEISRVEFFTWDVSYEKGYGQTLKEIDFIPEKIATVHMKGGYVIEICMDIYDIEDEYSDSASYEKALEAWYGKYRNHQKVFEAKINSLLEVEDDFSNIGY